MKSILLLFGILLAYSVPASADDAADVRAMIERHYAGINTQQNDEIFSHHRPDFTMFGADGSVLWEAGFEQTAERMNASLGFSDLDVRMAGFNAQIYGDVAVATFYLVGSQILRGETTSLNNRVTAVWIKQGREWKEAHHHESPLNPQ
jgi:ketosteroid isomerase-like protein